MPQFGVTDPAAYTGTLNLDSGRKSASKFNLPVAGQVTKLSYYGAGNAFNSQPIKGLIYSNTSSLPDVLLGVTDPTTVAISQALGWIDLVFASPVSLAAGDYWLGVIAGPASTATTLNWKSLTGGARAATGCNYTTPENPFGTSSNSDLERAINATYTTGNTYTKTGFAAIG